MSGIAFDTTLGKFVIAYNDYRGSSSNTPYGTAVTLQLASTNSSDFAGITNQAINNSASGEVVVEGGVITNGSLSLTVGATYYVQDDGSLQSDTVTVPYSLNSASYDDVSFDYSGQDGSGQQVLFKPDGTKMYILGSVNDSVFEYDLSSAFDLSTASYQRSKSVSSQDNFPVGLAFNSNGTKMFITGNTNDAVFQYSLSGAYDVSTASYDSVSFSVTSQDTAPYGLFFNNDGTKMFVVGDAGNDINEYALSSGFDISTASYTRNFSVASQETNPRHVSFNPDGTKMYVVGTQNDKIQVYSLTTGFDLSTASFLRAFAVNTEDTQPNGITFNANGTKVFLIGQSEDKVFQYTAGVGSVTSVTAGKAIANTTLLLKG
jgi:sugar lactone lactonase YvrE